MTTVYLDQNKWIDLSRAHHGEKGGGSYEEVLAKIRRVSGRRGRARSTPSRQP